MDAPRPEDDDDFVPQMPTGYAAEYRDAPSHRNIDETSDDELAAHDIVIEEMP